MGSRSTNPTPFPRQTTHGFAMRLTPRLATCATQVNDESLEKWPDAGAAANIGIMLFRKKSLDFVEKWIEIIEADDKVWDQNAFNDLFRRSVGRDGLRQSQLN